MIAVPATYRIPPHTHKASENVSVLTGVFFIGVGEKFDAKVGEALPTGGFGSIPPKHPHYAWAAVVSVKPIGRSIWAPPQQNQ